MGGFGNNRQSVSEQSCESVDIRADDTVYPISSPVKINSQNQVSKPGRTGNYTYLQYLRRVLFVLPAVFLISV